MIQNKVRGGRALRIAVGITALVLLMAGGAGALTLNASGGDCTKVGTWDSGTKTCSLTIDLTEPIQIDSNGITLDGNGRTITGSNTGSGVYLSGRNNVNIKNLNVKGFSNGIYLYFSSSNTLSNNNALNNEVGIDLEFSSNNTLSSNIMSGNERNFDFNGYQDSDFNNQIDTGNLVDGKPIYYIKNAKNTVYDSSTNAGTFYCISCVNVTIKDLNLNKNGAGVFFWNTTFSRIQNVNASNNLWGIYLVYFSNNTLSGNTASNNYLGIYLYYSSNNTLSSNTASNNYWNGIYLYSSSSNVIYHNNFINNIQNANSISHTNSWDSGYPGGGNYWSDYTGVDIKSGVNQDQPGSDDIGDTPHNISGGAGAQDRYPFMRMNGWLLPTTVISIASQAVNPNSTITVPITASNATDLSAFSVTLSYDPAVVWVDRVIAGDFGTPVSNINNATGSTSMSGISITGKSGNLALANVVLRAVGTGGQTSPLNISVTEMIDSNGNNIPVTVLNGTFTVQTASFTVAANRTNVSIVTPPIQPTPVMFTVMLGSTPVSGATVTLSGAATGSGTTTANGTVVILVSPTMNGTITAAAAYGANTATTALTAKGDVSGDGRVSITDALFIAQYTAGIRVLDSNTLVFADVSGDGRASITDALFIAQATAGIADRPVPKQGN